MKLQRLTLPEGHRLAQLHRLSGRVLRRIEPFIGNDVTHPFVDPRYLPGCIQIDCPRVPQFSVAIVSHP